MGRGREEGGREGRREREGKVTPARKGYIAVSGEMCTFPANCSVCIIIRAGNRLRFWYRLSGGGNRLIID